MLQNEKRSCIASSAIKRRSFDDYYFILYSGHMNTITVPKEKYKLLEKQAALFRNFLKSEVLFPIERYSTQRMDEFLEEDYVSQIVRDKAKAVLKKK